MRPIWIFALSDPAASCVRIELLSLAQGWRFVARLAHWQDKWAKDYEI